MLCPSPTPWRGTLSLQSEQLLLVGWISSWVGQLPSLTERHSGMVVPQTCPLHCINHRDGRMSATHEDFITQIKALLRLLISIVYLGNIWLKMPQGNSFNSCNYCFDLSLIHWIWCEGAWQCSRDQPHPGLQELKDAIHPGQNCCGRWLGRSSWCSIERKERIKLQKKVRNNKVSRSAVKQYHFSPCGQSQSENVEEKSAGYVNEPVSGLGLLIDSHCGLQDSSSFPSRDPHLRHITPESLQAAQHIPSECQNPLRSQRKSHPQALSTFLHFCCATHFPGL